MKICKIAGCQEKHLAKGLCNKHYYRKYRTGSAFGNPERFCSIPYCERKHQAKGLCNIHYNRALRKGNQKSKEGVVKNTNKEKVLPVKTKKIILSIKQEEVIRMMKKSDGFVSIDEIANNKIINTYSDERAGIRRLMERMRNRGFVNIARPGVYKIRESGSEQEKIL